MRAQSKQSHLRTCSVGRGPAAHLTRRSWGKGGLLSACDFRHFYCL
jgi:hypothetical protein